MIRCINVMQEVDKVPQLAYCKMQRSDVQLNRLDEQVEVLKPEQLTKKLTLIKTYNYGAATVINKSAKELVCRVWPEVDDLPHDMWVRSFTLGAAAELIPYGIVVNAIAPGPVATAMLGRKEGDTLYTDCIPAKRFATPSEIGQLAVIMVSDMCDLVIGDTFYISGGSGTIQY